MTTIAQKNGKFIIKDGKLVLGDPNDSECGCCDCCWRITQLSGCPSPEVAIENNTKISITFKDSENSIDCDPDPCKPPTNALTSTSDKTRCGITQLVKMTTKWAIKEPTSVTVSLSGNVETKDKGYDKTTVILKKCSDSKLIGCGVSASAGGAGVTINTYTYESEEKELEFVYDAYSIPDAFLVEGGGNVFVDTGSVSGSGSIVFCKPAGVTEITVTVTGPDGTGWEYGIGCPELWARGSIYSGCGESKDLEADQYDYKQISISSTTVANNTSCNMENVSNSKTFELEPGCWKVEMLSSTIDGLHHIDMWANVEFSFSGTAPECSEKMCTTFECIGGTGTGDGAGGEAGDVEDNGGIVDLEPGGEATGGLYGTCKAKEYDPQGPESYVELLDCLQSCDNSSSGCVNSFYYCCINGRCRRFKMRVCNNEDPSVECAPAGPQFCTKEECLSSPECMPETLVCKTDDNGIKSCVEWEPGNDVGLVLYPDQESCEANLDVAGSFCQQTTSGNWVITYDNIQICRPECEEGYICNENVECEPSLPTEAEYITYEECLGGCIPRYSCMPNQECVRDIDGTYTTLEECLQQCVLDPDPNSYYCCYDKPIDEDPTSVACVLGGCKNEEGIHIPSRVAGGPYKAPNPNISQIMCAEFCRKHTCGPCASCVGNVNGEYLSKTECEKGGRGKPACKQTFDPEADCELDGPIISSYINPQFPNQPAGSKRNMTELYYTVSPSKRTVCIDILNKTRKPKAAVLIYPRIQNCVERGYSVAPIYNSNNANTSLKFIGAKGCDCDARGDGSLDTSRDQVYKKWRKAEGVKWFIIRIIHPCELPGDIVEYEVTCSDSCDQPKDLGEADPQGACCTTDENGIVTCAENIPQSFCQGDNEKFAICVGCDPDPCEEKRGACCGGPGEGGCEDNVTEDDCLESGGIFYENERCKGQAFPDGVLCDGLCCVKEWKYVGSIKIEEIDVVDKVVVKSVEDPDDEAIEIQEWIDNNGVIDCETVNSTEIPTCQGGEINIEIETKKIKVIKVLQKQDHEIALANCINTTPAYLDENLSTEIIKNITLPTIDCNNITQISSIEKESYILFTDSNNINTINLATEYSPPYSLAKTNEDAYKLSDLSDITASQYNELPSIVTVPLSETAIVERSNNPFIPDEIGKYHIYISCYRTCEGNISKDRCSDYNDTNPDKPIAEYLVRGFWHYTKCEEEEENYCENNDVVEPAIAQIPLAPLNQKQTLQPIKIHPKTVVIGQTQKTTPSGGPGTELKKLLGMIGIKATEGCSCNSRAKTMDQWGPDLCEENISTIIDWLKQEAKKRGLPFVDRLAALIIKRAIRNARKNVQ